MIQINLLPDVKQHFIKARRVQRLTILISVFVAGIALIIFLLLLTTVKLWQKQRINSLSNQIKTDSNELKSTVDLDRILTVQQQLNALPNLHAEKPAVKRLFRYLTQITPAQISISNIKVNFTDKTLGITGLADKLEAVNKFVDTLKFTTYAKSDTPDDAKPAFTNVVLKSFSRDAKRSAYELELLYEANIFDSKISDVVLVVPKNFITTRSETQRPNALFEPNSTRSQ